jgi:GR25 family glycosyltransferase involved in LPS biosynthesis
MRKIPVVIIATPNSERHHPLKQSILTSEAFEVHLIRATMGSELGEPSISSEKSEIVSYGRVLSQNERACSISHQRARHLIAESELGGIIFEDDARVVNLATLQQAVQKFLELHVGKKSILGLLQYENRPFLGTNSRHFNEVKIIPLLKECPLAVATVFTPFAARELAAMADRKSQLADWPLSKCRFYFLARGCIMHGDSQTESVIGLTESRKFGSSPVPIADLVKMKVRRLIQKLDLIWIELMQRI